MEKHNSIKLTAVILFVISGISLIMATFFAVFNSSFSSEAKNCTVVDVTQTMIFRYASLNCTNIIEKAIISDDNIIVGSEIIFYACSEDSFSFVNLNICINKIYMILAICSAVISFLCLSSSFCLYIYWRRIKNLTVKSQRIIV